jgi:hypothetical protein
MKLIPHSPHLSAARTAHIHDAGGHIPDHTRFLLSTEGNPVLRSFAAIIFLRITGSYGVFYPKLYDGLVISGVFAPESGRGMVPPDPEKAPYLVLDQKIVGPLFPVPAWNEFCPTHLNRTQKVCFNMPSIV